MLDAPVPPSKMAKSVIPVIFPPVILMLLLFWTDIDPRPRLDLASPGVDAPVPPSTTFKSVIPFILPPVIFTL